MFRKVIFLIFSLIYATARSQVTDCTAYNASLGAFGYGLSNTDDHLTGNHNWSNVTSGSCTYTGSGYGVSCAVTSQAIASATKNESGITITQFHVGNTGTAQGTSAANGGSVTADAEAAVGFEKCTIPGCIMTVSVNGSGQGAGFSVSFNPQPFWNDKHYFKNTCQAESTASCAQYPPPAMPNGCYPVWDPSSCTWSQQCRYSSPLIIDTMGKGFHMTDPKTGCVTFNLDGTPKCYSWPDPQYGDGFLVYDANDDGVISNGDELFGDVTPHSDGGVPNHPDPNGFLALAWYDQPAQGGDQNLIIDKHDKIWPKLKVWIDQHCYKNPTVSCVSTPGELLPLAAIGINSISLVYTSQNHFTDSFGNRFKFNSPLNPGAEDKPTNEKGESCCEQHQHSSDSRLIYDVYLQQKQP